MAEVEFEKAAFIMSLRWKFVKMSTMSFSSKSNAKESAAVSAVQLSGSQLRKPRSSLSVIAIFSPG